MEDGGGAPEAFFLPEDEVRRYIRKRKRAQKSISVTHLRKALNIGYKKAKRIYDEFVTSESMSSAPKSKSKSNSKSKIKSKSKSQAKPKPKPKARTSTTGRRKRRKLNNKAEAEVEAEDEESSSSSTSSSSGTESESVVEDTETSSGGEEVQKKKRKGGSEVATAGEAPADASSGANGAQTGAAPTMATAMTTLDNITDDEEEEEEEYGDLDPFTLANCLLKAAHFAATKHRSQKRKDTDGTPYINHPLGVAWCLSEEGGVKDVETLQAAMLHDTVEDTDTTFEELKREFGVKVADIVLEVTDDKSMAKDARKKHQVKHAPHLSKQAKLVKLADKLYNLRDLLRDPVPGWSVQRVQGYFAWANAVVESIRGTNIGLEEKLDEVFSSKFKMRNKSYPALVAENRRPALLAKYYADMAETSD